MHFDALSLACVVDELNGSCVPGRVQQVLLAGEHALGFEIYTPGTRHQLLIALDAGLARMHTVTYKLRRGVEGETPFLLLLRKYVRGALLAAVDQPDATERVARLHFEHAEHGQTTLICEFIGRQPNALLLRADGRILECLHRVLAADGGRALMPGRPYAPPPPMDKLAPVDDGSDGYYERFSAALDVAGPLWKALVTGVAGLSPTAAREIAWRAARDIDAPASGVSVLAVAQALQAVWAPVTTGEWQPGIVEANGAVAGYAAYPLHGRGDFVASATLSAALERYAASGGAARRADPYAALRGQVQAQVRRARTQVTRRLEALAGDEPVPGEAELLRSQANWLLALHHEIAPGQRILHVDTGSEEFDIALDSRFSPVEQAQRMFKRAAKLERAAAIIPQRRAELLADLALLEQLALDTAQADNQPELAAVTAELRTAGLMRGAARREPRSKAPPAGPIRYRTPRGVEIVAGRNARQNEQVTFRLAQPDDLWLHARAVPGAHVIVRGGGRSPDEEDVALAARLAAYRSAASGDRSVDVIVTERRWVSRAPGGRPGQVLVARERVIAVPGDAPEGLVERD